MCIGLLAVFLSPPEGHARVSWSTPGTYRLWLLELNEFQLDETGKTYPQAAYGLHRLRLKPKVEVGMVQVHLEFDVLTGQIFGTTTTIGSNQRLRQDQDPARAYDGWVTVIPRQAWFAVTTEWLTLKLGQYADQWGLGLVANAGDEALERSWIVRPGGLWNGDLVDRIELSISPFAGLLESHFKNLSLLAGAGTVFQDERVHLLDGGSVSELYTGLLYRGETNELGFRYTHREEARSEGDQIVKQTVDAYGHSIVPLYLSNSEVRVAAHAVVSMAERTRPSGVSEQIGYAGLGRIEYRWHCPRLAVGLDLGYVSGDRADTATDESFTTDPGFRAGFIIFDSVLRQLTVREASRASADGLDGAYETPTHGGVRNARYVRPGVSWRPGAFFMGLNFLVAWTDEPVFSVQNTTINQIPRDYFGIVDSEFYGTEATVTLRYEPVVRSVTAMSMGLDLGVLVPGPALTPETDGSPISKILWRVDLGW